MGHSHITAGYCFPSVAFNVDVLSGQLEHLLFWLQAEYLAEGEAPEELRNVLRQRSRWTKGHMQVSVAKGIGSCTYVHDIAHWMKLQHIRSSSKARCTHIFLCRASYAEPILQQLYQHLTITSIRCPAIHMRVVLCRCSLVVVIHSYVGSCLWVTSCCTTTAHGGEMSVLWC